MKLHHLTLPALALLVSCSAAPMRTEVRSSSSRSVPEMLDPVELGAPAGVWEGAPLTEAELAAEAEALSASRESATPVEAAAPVFAEPQPRTADSSEEPTAAELARANNPLADIKTISIQNYYAPQISGLPDQTSNTLWARYAQPINGWLLRASMPFRRTPTSPTDSESGLGDFNVFATYLMSEANAPVTYGVGPLLVLPTASDDALGSGQWQAGAAAVYFNAESSAVQFGGLVTYQTDFAGPSSRDDTSLLAVQPFAFFQLGGDKYLRSSAIMAFNWVNGDYRVPLGFGIGKVFKMESGSVLNIYMEPQFTVLEDGTGQPEFQLFFGVNTQFM